MEIEKFYKKFKTESWNKLVKITKSTPLYLYIYRSYWNSAFSRGKQKNNTAYYGAIPNPGAGIGHQLANWIAGYWFAKQFGLTFVHIPFSTNKWEKFLGLGEGEKNLTDLKIKGYKIRRLPLFDENNSSQVHIQKKIISSYSGAKVVFIAEQDQFYMDQFGVMNDLKRKFNNAVSRNSDKVIYDNNFFNIAVHVRRTVVIDSKIIVENEEQKAKRWLSNDYYEKVLKQVLENLVVSKPLKIFIFSTGKAEEFNAFSKYGDIRICSDLDEYASFLHLVKADLLITSKSSFSYKAALMNDGIKVCPANFWHGYPETRDWVLCENDGSFNIYEFKEVLE